MNLSIKLMPTVKDGKLIFNFIAETEGIQMNDYQVTLTGETDFSKSLSSLLN